MVKTHAQGAGAGGAVRGAEGTAGMATVVRKLSPTGAVVETSLRDLLQSAWREGRLPLVDGVVLASGDVFTAMYGAVTVNGIRGAAPVFGAPPAPLESTADWIEVDERGAVSDSHADLRYSCGEGNAGGDGYVACARASTGELVWAALFQASNPFEAIRLDGTHLEVVNNLGHRWRFACGHPTDVSVI